MASDHQAQVDELLADYRRSRDRLADMQRSLAAVNESVTSSDGLVKATVGAHGTLTDLVIADAAYVRTSPSDLAKLIVRTAAAAATKASETANRTVSPLLPVHTDPAALLAGRADLTPAELAPPARRADDDSFEDVSWMDGGRS
ncbi:YbaB/EbfC family nucleoid-associated protein [Actinocrispum wychmicini]|uniref:DNA-binding protein YbaB n=1 Tax=Actinocrispum wychmicini TaxID=1213861 RepID=A0A4R2JYC3_9PSEU|nr:YbaB/EbfC family nucleoid-associated protein [Actinocrispum wychmicini]TCO65611.1 DNA-binding protein YbaB [Actinocrispum wychmicini]